MKLKKQIKEINIKEFAYAMKNRIDNTGHILWPAEEILAYLLKVFYESKLSKYNRVIELGSGYNGLAGIMWSKLVEFTYKKA